MQIVISLTMAFLSLLAIVGAGSFAARRLEGRKLKWLGVVIAIACYFLIMSAVSSLLGSADAAPTLSSILLTWAASVSTGLASAAATTVGLRRLLPAISG